MKMEGTQFFTAWGNLMAYFAGKDYFISILFGWKVYFASEQSIWEYLSDNALSYNGLLLNNLYASFWVILNISGKLQSYLEIDNCVPVRS